MTNLRWSAPSGGTPGLFIIKLISSTATAINTTVYAAINNNGINILNNADAGLNWTFTFPSASILRAIYPSTYVNGIFTNFKRYAATTASGPYTYVHANLSGSGTNANTVSYNHNARTLEFNGLIAGQYGFTVPNAPIYITFEFSSALILANLP